MKPTKIARSSLKKPRLEQKTGTITKSTSEQKRGTTRKPTPEQKRGTTSKATPEKPEKTNKAKPDPSKKQKPLDSNKTKIPPSTSKDAPKQLVNKIQSIIKNVDPNSSGQLVELASNLSQNLKDGVFSLEDIQQLSKFIPNSLAGLQSKKIIDEYLTQLRLTQTKDTQLKSSPKVDDYRSNYITNNRFYVEMDREVKAAFKEFSGINVKIKKDNYFEGGVNDQVRVLLGHADFADVTLKRGMTNDLTFLKWILETLKGKRENRRNINILLYNQAGQTMQGYTLIGAIPINWKIPGVQADGNAVAIEELTLAYEGLSFIENATGSSPTTNLKRDSLGFFPSK